MLLFIYGPDTYRSRRKLQEIIASYKKTNISGFNLRFFNCQDFGESGDGDIFSLEAFQDELRQVSLFGAKKLAVVTNPFTNTQTRDELFSFFKGSQDSKDVVVIYQEGEVKKRDPLYEFLKKNAKCQEFEILEGAQLKAWARKEIEQGGGKIEGKALDILLVSVGSDPWRMANEIQKLLSFKNGETIQIADVIRLVRANIETDIFKTIDALAQRDTQRALQLTHKHLEKGDAPLYLLSMINFQFRNLLQVKDLIEKGVPYEFIAKKTGLHPFVIKKSYWQAQHFGLAELKKIYHKIFQVDSRIKTGRIDPETALDLLIAGL